MSAAAILAIDQGTTNTKALLVRGDGSVIARASCGVEILHPRPGWAEQSAFAIWQSVCDAIAAVVAKAPNVPIAAVAIANQRETIVVWDAETGVPIANAATWQCRRSSALCARLRGEGHEADIMQRTGLGLDPLFPSGKIAWLLDNAAGARNLAARGALRIGTVDSWLLWQLTGGRVHATDASNASRTQLFAIDALTWDSAMLALFDVPAFALPTVLPSDSRFGETAIGATILPAGIPIHAMLGDSHAALLGHGFDRPGQAKVTCGTGSSLMATTGARVQSTHGLASTIAWQKGDTPCYALEGNVAVSGHAAAFAVRLLGLDGENELTTLAQTVSSSEGVVFVPALAGLGAPHWDDRARGLLSGMSLGTTPAHVARAVLEGIALQIGDVFTAMEADLGARVDTLSVDGGASRSDMLMGLLADVVDRPVLRPDHAEMGALGVARLAAEAIGMGGTAASPPKSDRFDPTITADARAAMLSDWRHAVARAASTQKIRG